MNKQIYARRTQAKKEIQKVAPDITEDSGIYIYERTQKYIYIGQARSLMQRCVGHRLSYDQRIDISLKKHGYFDPIFNKNGWKLRVLQNCDIDRLDAEERYWIERYKQDPSIELLNITGGGQGDKASDIAERKPSKGYRDGVKQGREKVIKELNERLLKGDIELVIKNPNKIKQKHLDKILQILKEE